MNFRVGDKVRIKGTLLIGTIIARLYTECSEPLLRVYLRDGSQTAFAPEYLIPA
jgi:hypothetical protein